ncbi:MAG TPA: hypothetical protein EYN68_00400 [Candidatus Marinimicrobia bacterium]|nr:hypothetical protein [Candidatus Neomarinimicrobiota bacterium]HIB96395.1 hypothetical protein [Candidatus Neomarinimicrobiota bacterium]HIC74966.1 hypothetical protein [Candidatus Neomarinimicrobiota bacterium]HIO73965.1 hypothetical protein [Candidatus Neomarinimicrobiota bacterium]
MTDRKLSNLSRGAMFVALAVGSGFALLMVPNIELITAVVFTSGVYVGTGWGLTVGIVAEFIFSAANPLGSGVVFLPMLLAQMCGMGLVGAVGGRFRGLARSSDWTWRRRTFFGAAGVVLTFIFDALTTLSYPLAAGYPVTQTAALFVTGIGFTFLHQVANGVIFATALPKVFSRLKP